MLQKGDMSRSSKIINVKLRTNKIHESKHRPPPQNIIVQNIPHRTCLCKSHQHVRERCQRCNKHRHWMKPLVLPKMSFMMSSSVLPANLFVHLPPHALGQHQAQHPEMVHPAQDLIKSDGNSESHNWKHQQWRHHVSDMSYWSGMPIWIRSRRVGLLSKIKRFVTE